MLHFISSFMLKGKNCEKLWNESKRLLSILSESAFRLFQSFIAFKLFHNPINFREMIIRQKVLIHQNGNYVQWNATDYRPCIVNNFTSFATICNFFQYSWCLYICPLHSSLNCCKILLINDLIKICDHLHFMSHYFTIKKIAFSSGFHLHLLLLLYKIDFDLNSKYFIISRWNLTKQKRGEVSYIAKKNSRSLCSNILLNLIFNKSTIFTTSSVPKSLEQGLEKPFL